MVSEHEGRLVALREAVRLAVSTPLFAENEADSGSADSTQLEAPWMIIEGFSSNFHRVVTLKKNWQKVREFPKNDLI